MTLEPHQFSDILVFVCMVTLILVSKYSNQYYFMFHLYTGILNEF